MVGRTVPTSDGPREVAGTTAPIGDSRSGEGSGKSFYVIDVSREFFTIPAIKLCDIKTNCGRLAVVRKSLVGILSVELSYCILGITSEETAVIGRT